MKEYKIAGYFSKKFWDFGAALNRHRAADKTVPYKTQQRVDEKNFGGKVRNGETKSHQTEEETDSIREERAGQLGEYVWFVKLRWKLADLICEV